MSLKFSSLFGLCFSFFFLFSTVPAFNITKILSQYPDFSTFNNYLTQTQIADQINSRQTITILAIENGNISPLSGQSMDIIKRVLGVHVILDYYDVPKLQKLQNKTALLTTLFQSSGQAIGQQGFVNVTDLSTGAVAFGSAVPGSSLNANLVKSITSQPYNVSVLQVSNVIMPSGIGNTNSTNATTAPPPPSPTPASPPKSSPPPAASPEKPPSAKAPSPSTSKSAPPSIAKPPAAGAPTVTPSNNATPPANADSPTESPPPAVATAPTTDTPIASPPAMEGPTAANSAAEGPVVDGPAAAADAPSEGSSGAPAKVGISLAAFVIMIISSAWALA